MFCKLFETKEYGQILVMLEDGDDGASVRFFFDPGVEVLGVCNIAIGFSASEEGWDAAEACLAATDEEKAIHIIKPVIDKLRSVKE